MFFQKYSEMINGGESCHLIIEKKTGGQMRVYVLPKSNNTKDAAANKIPPLLIEGEAAELDKEFFENLTKPLQKAYGVLRNMEQYEKGLKAAQAASKERKDKEGKVNPLLTKAKQLEDSGKKGDALKKYKEVLEIEPDNKKAKEGADRLQSHFQSNSLFGTSEENEPVIPTDGTDIQDIEEDMEEKPEFDEEEQEKIEEEEEENEVPERDDSSEFGAATGFNGVQTGGNSITALFNELK